jgi:hypothetical protein
VLDEIEFFFDFGMDFGGFHDGGDFVEAGVATG